MYLIDVLWWNTICVDAMWWWHIFFYLCFLNCCYWCYYIFTEWYSRVGRGNASGFCYASTIKKNFPNKFWYGGGRGVKNRFLALHNKFSKWKNPKIFNFLWKIAKSVPWKFFWRLCAAYQKCFAIIGLGNPKKNYYDLVIPKCRPLSIKNTKNHHNCITMYPSGPLFVYSATYALQRIKTNSLEIVIIFHAFLFYFKHIFCWACLYEYNSTHSAWMDGWFGLTKKKISCSFKFSEDFFLQSSSLI